MATEMSRAERAGRRGRRRRGGHAGDDRRRSGRSAQPEVDATRPGSRRQLPDDRRHGDIGRRAQAAGRRRQGVQPADRPDRQLQRRRLSRSRRRTRRVQRSGSGSSSAWTTVRRCVERVSATYERTHPLLDIADDLGRLDDDDAVEFETLHDADRHERDPGVEAGAGGRAVVDPGVGERRRQIADQAVGRDDAEAAVGQFADERQRPRRPRWRRAASVDAARDDLRAVRRRPGPTAANAATAWRAPSPGSPVP